MYEVKPIEPLTRDELLNIFQVDAASLSVETDNNTSKEYALFLNKTLEKFGVNLEEDKTKNTVIRYLTIAAGDVGQSMEYTEFVDAEDKKTPKLACLSLNEIVPHPKIPGEALCVFYFLMCGEFVPSPQNEESPIFKPTAIFYCREFDGKALPLLDSISPDSPENVAAAICYANDVLCSFCANTHIELDVYRVWIDGQEDAAHEQFDTIRKWSAEDFQNAVKLRNDQKLGALPRTQVFGSPSADSFRIEGPRGLQ